MIDIKFLRENPDIVKQNIKNKFQDKKLPLVDEVIKLDIEYRKAKSTGDELRNKRKTLSLEIGNLMKSQKKDEALKIKEEVNKVNKDLELNEELENSLYSKINEIMLKIPNCTMNR